MCARIPAPGRAEGCGKLSGAYRTVSGVAATHVQFLPGARMVGGGGHKTHAARTPAHAPTRRHGGGGGKFLFAGPLGNVGVGLLLTADGGPARKCTWPPCQGFSISPKVLTGQLCEALFFCMPSPAQPFPLGVSKPQGSPGSRIKAVSFLGSGIHSTPPTGRLEDKQPLSLSREFVAFLLGLGCHSDQRQASTSFFPAGPYFTLSPFPLERSAQK